MKYEYETYQSNSLNYELQLCKSLLKTINTAIAKHFFIFRVGA